MALGTKVNSLIRDTTPGMDETDRHGIAISEETGMTSRAGVFAGGDAVTGAATVIKAMGAGKIAASGMDLYIKNADK